MVVPGQRSTVGLPGEDVGLRVSTGIHVCTRTHSRFPNLGIWQRTENPREFDFGGQWDLITGCLRDWGNRLLEGTNQTLCTPGPRDPPETETEQCLGVS